MGGFVRFNREKFSGVFDDLLQATRAMVEALEGVGDPREICMIQAMKQLETYMEDLLSAVDSGKKMLWHGGLISPEIFLAFENVHPYALEIPCALLSFLDPEGVNDYIDAAENLGIPSDVCPVDKAVIGATLEEIQPPADIIVIPTTPCDSIITGHQILERLVEAPVFYCDVPYSHDDRGVELYSHHIWKIIGQIEEICHTRMDWDKCREHVKLANEVTEFFLAENEMRKLSPCPHPGKLSTVQTILNYLGSGTTGARDVAKFILEDSKRLAAEKKGALVEERLRLLWYMPEPFYDLALHDWQEDEYGAITALTMFGHATTTLIDPSTPDSIVRGYAWKMMNTPMTRQFRGPYEYFMDDFITALEGWNVDAAFFPFIVSCKHSQALHGFVREACREREIPLGIVDYDHFDSRPVSIDRIHSSIADFLETQVLPLK